MFADFKLFILLKNQLLFMDLYEVLNGSLTVEYYGILQL